MFQLCFYFFSEITDESLLLLLLNSKITPSHKHVYRKFLRRGTRVWIRTSTLHARIIMSKWILPSNKEPIKKKEVSNNWDVTIVNHTTGSKIIYTYGCSNIEINTSRKYTNMSIVIVVMCLDIFSFGVFFYPFCFTLIFFATFL